jgi:hypothetical protein
MRHLQVLHAVPDLHNAPGSLVADDHRLVHHKVAEVALQARRAAVFAGN